LISLVITPIDLAVWRYKSVKLGHTLVELPKKVMEEYSIGQAWKELNKIDGKMMLGLTSFASTFIRFTFFLMLMSHF